MLDVYGVKATFFIPGVIAEHYPLVVKEIRDVYKRQQYPGVKELLDTIDSVE